MQHYPITLVTAYFDLEDPVGGRSARDYRAWMANLLPFIRWPLVIFCDERSVHTIKRLRGQKPAVYCVTSLEEFFVYRHRDIIHAHVAQRIPGSNTARSLVYHEKANFVRRAIDMQAFGSEMFFWCDIGLCRGGEAQAWFSLSDRIEFPNLQACRAASDDKVAFWSKWVWSGVWGGRQQPTRRFCDAYYDLLERYVGEYSSVILNGVVVPHGRGFTTEERLFRRLYAGAEARFTDMRLLTEDDIRWVRILKRITKYSHQIFSYRELAVLYCLNSDRFPWAYLGREISLPVCVRRFVPPWARSVRRRVLNKISAGFSV